MHVEGNFCGNNAFDFRDGMWRADPAESPAGGMGAMGIHMVDALIHLCGPVTSVRAQSFRQVLEIPVDDMTSMLFRIESGISGYLETITATPWLWRIQAFGSKSWAHMRDPGIIDLRRQDKDHKTLEFPAVDIELAELDAFADAVAGRASYPVIPAQAVHGITVFEAVIKSAERDGERVEVT